MEDNYFIKRIIICIFIFYIFIKLKLICNDTYFYKINKRYNLNSKNKIKLAIFAYRWIGGGVQKFTYLLLKYFSKLNIFDVFYIKKINAEIVTHLNNIKYIFIDGNGHILENNLINILIQNNIDIIIYQFKFRNEMNRLIQLNKTKTIFINHSCFLLWIYTHDYNIFNNVYDIYKNSKYVVSIVPFENHFLFKKWGIHSIYMNNLISYDYENIRPSSLSSNIILMLGSASAKNKRFYLGIESMKYIVQKISNCEMKIISNSTEKLNEMIYSLNLQNNVKFTGYSKTPEIFFKNASLHIFPTISEAFPMALCETKIYGIPTIITGIDYTSISEGGVIIIYDDNPESIAKESIKLLKNRNYRKKMGKQARKSMKKFNNQLIVKKWINIICSVYKGENYYQKLLKEDYQKDTNKYLNLLKKQLQLLKIREPIMKNISLNNILDFNFMKNISFFINKKRNN